MGGKGYIKSAFKRLVEGAERAREFKGMVREGDEVWIYNTMVWMRGGFESCFLWWLRLYRESVVALSLRFWKSLNKAVVCIQCTYVICAGA